MLLLESSQVEEKCFLVEIQILRRRRRRLVHRKIKHEKLGKKILSFLLLSCLCCNYTPQYPIILMDRMRALYIFLQQIPKHATSIVGK
jgi:hypothetical protein